MHATYFDRCLDRGIACRWWMHYKVDTFFSSVSTYTTIMRVMLIWYRAPAGRPTCPKSNPCNARLVPVGCGPYGLCVLVGTSPDGVRRLGKIRYGVVERWPVALPAPGPGPTRDAPLLPKVIRVMLVWYP